MNTHPHYRWDDNNLAWGQTYIGLRRHVQEAHPDIYLGLRNDVLAERHRKAHEEES